jgi:hypothetical protein
MATGQYDPKRLLINFFGITLTGFQDGTFLSIKRVAADYKTIPGGDGRSIRVRMHNLLATMEVTLQHDSPTNAALMALRTAGLALGEDVGPFSFIDQLSGESVIAPESWIEKTPDIEHGTDPGPRLWIFGTGSLEELIGGGVL